MKTAGPVLLASYVSFALPAQDVLHYRFDEGGGRRVVNHAADSGAAPSEGTLVSNAGYSNSTLFASGRFGTALRGAAVEGKRIAVDTDWNGAFDDRSFSVALFLKSRRAFDRNGWSMLFYSGRGNYSEFRGYIGRGAQFVVEGVSSAPLEMGRDVWTPAQRRWVHVACVYDRSQRLVFFYLDGVMVNRRRLTHRIIVRPAAEDFVINAQGLTTTSGQSRYDIDEFRFSLRAASAGEVSAWATREPPTDGPFGRGCAPKGLSPLLESNSATAGPPRIGNGAYAYRLFGHAQSAYVLSIGSNRLSLQSVSLPLDLGLIRPSLAGCLWESSMDIAQLRGVLSNAGAAQMPLPIANDPRLLGTSLWNQAIMVHPFTGTFMTTNAFVTSIGN